ncbi:hypothetical protein EV702DRAFT_1134065 [Suillus placidus]|uniref:Uncharacterized protein n=1 Tax=Suillus placidus TaxID=48579 RepID=A0A9P6ZMJ9_9AGAM|nr:hypothetical protein EV702DRAFT_1134065 [Suillus placidus]
MSFMLEGVNVSELATVARDDSSEISLLSVSFLNSYALARSREGMFRALVTLLEGDVRFSTDFPFTLRDILPAMVVLGRDWYAFCHDILHSHPEVWLLSCEWTLMENLGRDRVVDDGSLVNKAAQAGCFVIAQDMVRQEIVHELLIVLSDKDGSVTTVNEIAAAHTLDMSVGHASVRDQFVRHLFTGFCVVKGSSGGGGRACAAIARGFPEVSSLMDYMLGYH